MMRSMESAHAALMSNMESLERGMAAISGCADVIGKTGAYGDGVVPLSDNGLKSPDWTARQNKAFSLPPSEYPAIARVMARYPRSSDPPGLAVDYPAIARVIDTRHRRSGGQRPRLDSASDRIVISALRRLLLGAALQQWLWHGRTLRLCTQQRAALFQRTPQLVHAFSVWLRSIAASHRLLAHNAT